MVFISPDHKAGYFWGGYLRGVGKVPTTWTPGFFLPDAKLHLEQGSLVRVPRMKWRETIHSWSHKSMMTHHIRSGHQNLMLMNLGRKNPSAGFFVILGVLRCWTFRRKFYDSHHICLKTRVSTWFWMNNSHILVSQITGGFNPFEQY